MGDRRQLRGILVAALYWNMWKERNRMIFSNSILSPDACHLSILANISLQTGMISDEERLQLSDNSGGFLDHLL